MSDETKASETSAAPVETPAQKVEEQLEHEGKKGEAEAKAEAEKEPVTLEKLYECVKGLEARFDWFAELVLDSDAITDVIAVVEASPEAEPEKKPEAQREPAKGPEPERKRRHGFV